MIHALVAVVKNSKIAVEKYTNLIKNKEILNDSRTFKDN